MSSKKAIIIGAGIGGIATSIRLAVQGFNVSVYEANSYPGGKLTSFEEKGYRFDMGPSLFTMPQFVEELFLLAQKPIKDYFSYTQKDVVANYFYEDGTTFTAYANQKKFIDSATKTFNVKSEELEKYFEESKKKYDLTASIFLEKSLHKAATYFSKETLKALVFSSQLGINTSLSAYNSKSFTDERLVQFFNRFATYNGSSPYKTPGIMSMIPHLEQYYGTYYPKGGMQSITSSLTKLAEDLGVKFHYNSLVDQVIVEQNKIKAIRVKGERIEADIVVSNSDIVPTYRKLLKTQKAPEKILKQPRSSSALIFYWGIKGTFPELDLHNLFFSADYKGEFEQIFEHNTIGDDPTVYVNISSKEEKEDAPDGCENWFTMINVPSNTNQNWDELIEKARKSILKKLSRLLNIDIEPLIEFEQILEPRTIESRTQSYQGALYGASSNNKFAAFLRHPNFKSNIKGLYFCGGSVHPGGGIPLCLLSGKIVADLIEQKS